MRRRDERGKKERADQQGRPDSMVWGLQSPVERSALEETGRGGGILFCREYICQGEAGWGWGLGVGRGGGGDSEMVPGGWDPLVEPEGQVRVAAKRSGHLGGWEYLGAHVWKDTDKTETDNV